MYTIAYSEDVATDLEALTARERGLVLDRVELQLKFEPARQSRNRKILEGLVPPWDYLPPVWELRVGEYRVFYDVDEVEQLVIVRAVRHKPPHMRTEEIL